MESRGEINRKLNRAIASVCDKWLLIEEINLEDNSFEVLLDNLGKLGIPIPRNCTYDEQLMQLQELIAPEYQADRQMFCSRDNLTNALSKCDCVEMEYVVVAGENTWRRDEFKVVSWRDNQPVVVNWFHMGVDSAKARQLQQKEAIWDAHLQSEQAYKIKNLFSKNLSEHLQMPINMIVGNAAVAKTFSSNPDRVMQCMEEISMSAKAIFRMVRQMNRMNEMQEGKLTLQMQQTDVWKLWESVAEIVRPSLRMRGHTLHVDMAQLYHKYIIGDIQKLQQILVNLLQNAIDYTPYRGEIFLGIKEHPVDAKYGEFEIYIQDNGVGMSKEFCEVMFEPFAREHSNRIEEVDGAGLGLMIVRNLVRLMDGEIEVDSTCGKGTKITIYLKLLYGKEDGSETEGIPSFAWENIRTYGPAFSGEHVLLVDDNDMTAAVEERVLLDHGLVVERAINGEDAVAMFGRSPQDHYKIVLMDMGLPGISGYEAVMGIRNLGRTDGKDVPVVALTSSIYAEDFQEEQIGMKAQLEKPVLAQKLVETVRKYIK